MRKPIRNKVLYVAFTFATFAAFEFILNATVHRGYDPPQKHPFNNTWIVERDALSAREWNDLRHRFQIQTLTWFFATSGATLTLPSDFNTGQNTCHVVGAGAPGFGGQAGTNVLAGTGGTGGGGGAFARILNYAGHSAGQIVNIQVGTGDTWFDSTSILKAQAANGGAPGFAGNSVGTTVQNGGFGGTGYNPTACNPCTSAGGGGGGAGGAGGPHGDGATGSNGLGQAGGTGGAGDNGVTNGGTSGTQWNGIAGPGGGGFGGAGGLNGTSPGQTGTNGGFYGAGGGGGGGGASSIGGQQVPGGGGSGTQGLIAISYTPSPGAATAHSFAVILY